MTGSPLDVLRSYVAELDEYYGQEAHGKDALAQVETLVEAAKQMLSVYPDPTSPASNRLRAALAPFVSGSEGETA